MSHYQITAQGRIWTCEAVDLEWAKSLFEVNIGVLDDAALATLVDLDDYKPTPKKKPRH